MTNDGDWVEDVRRWYFNSGRNGSGLRTGVPRQTADEVPEVGYEAANPSIQTSAWSEPIPSAFGSLR